MPAMAPLRPARASWWPSPNRAPRSWVDRPGGDQGKSTHGTEAVDRELDIAGVDFVSPATIPSNTTTQVTVYGYGFTDSDVWSAVKYDEDTLSAVADSDITVANFAFVDDEEITLELTPASGLPPDYGISLQMERA